MDAVKMSDNNTLVARQRPCSAPKENNQVISKILSRMYGMYTSRRLEPHSR